MAPSKSQRWNQRKTERFFLDRILETSDATYGYQSCMTEVSHTHIHTAHMHAQKI